MFARFRHALRDDAGRPCRVVRQQTDTGTLGRARRRIIITAVPLAVGAASLALTAIGMFATATSAANSAVPGSTGSPDALRTLLVALAMGMTICVGFGLVLWFLYREWGASVDLDLFVSRRGRGRCGCCGFSLDGVPRGTNGLTTCPECTHAWGEPPPKMIAMAAKEDRRLENNPASRE